MVPLPTRSVPMLAIPAIKAVIAMDSANWMRAFLVGEFTMNLLRMMDEN
jgi:hypothetical protein